MSAPSSPRSPPPLPLKTGGNSQRNQQNRRNEQKKISPCSSSTGNSTSDWIELRQTPEYRHNLILGLAQSTSRLKHNDDSMIPLLPRDCTESPPTTLPKPTTTTATTTTQQQPKGPAPKAPSEDREEQQIICNQPQRSSSVSRGLQVETEDLIQFSNNQVKSEVEIVNNNNNNNIEKEFLEDLDDILEDESARTADEEMDYLESLDFCPHGAKCCIDSVITLFCVTLLG